MSHFIIKKLRAAMQESEKSIYVIVRDKIDKLRKYEEAAPFRKRPSK